MPGLSGQLEPLADTGSLMYRGRSRRTGRDGEEFPGRSLSFGRGLTRLLAWPFAFGRSGPLTLDVAKMYRDNVAPDPGNLLRGYGGSSAGAGVFYVLAGPLRAVPARKGR